MKHFKVNIWHDWHNSCANKTLPSLVIMDGSSWFVMVRSHWIGPDGVRTTSINGYNGTMQNHSNWTGPIFRALYVTVNGQNKYMCYCLINIHKDYDKFCSFIAMLHLFKWKTVQKYIVYRSTLHGSPNQKHRSNPVWTDHYTLHACLLVKSFNSFPVLHLLNPLT